MPDWDDGYAYWVNTNALVLANDREQPYSKHWPLFRDAGEALHAAYAGRVQLPNMELEKWNQDTFDKMWHSYCQHYPGQEDGVKALSTLRRYHVMKELGQFLVYRLIDIPAYRACCAHG